MIKPIPLARPKVITWRTKINRIHHDNVAEFYSFSISVGVVAGGTKLEFVDTDVALLITSSFTFARVPSAKGLPIA